MDKDISLVIPLEALHDFYIREHHQEHG